MDTPTNEKCPEVMLSLESSNMTPPPPLADPWSTKIQTYVENIKSDCLLKSEQHSEAGHHFRKLDIRWGLPSILIPATFAPLSVYANFWDTEENSVKPGDYIGTLGLFLTSIFTGVSGFFQYGQRSGKHYLYSAKYTDIATDIDAELIKKKEFRISADVFVQTIKMKYDNLIFGEPVVPKFITQTKKK